ncbi:MAG: hypothetical protein Kow0088_11670 [Anaerolineales bacterium]
MSAATWVKIGRNHTPLDPPLALKVCRTFSSRLRGFLFSSSPTPELGLLFWYSHPSRFDTAIHMIGVPFSLAVIWLDDNRKVIDKRIAQPWQFAIIPKSAAQYVIECHPQRECEFVIGEIIDFLGV